MGLKEETKGRHRDQLLRSQTSGVGERAGFVGHGCFWGIPKYEAIYVVMGKMSMRGLGIKLYSDYEQIL